MRVVINARIPSGVSGGVEQVIIGLASGLAEVAQEGEEYLFLMTRGEEAWLRPYVRGACRIVYGRTTPVARLRRMARRIPGMVQLYRFVRRSRSRVKAPPLPVSDGTAEQLHADVVHFPFQGGFVTSIPSVYQPWDLQHVHYPQFLTVEELLRRDTWYRAFCEQAAVVSVSTQWGKRDLEQHLGVRREKIEVIPLAPVLTAYAEPSAGDVAAVRRKHDLPSRFAYFPAHTWPHKNHLGLIRALASLRSRGLEYHAVFSGARTENARALRAEAKRLGVLSQVRFLGYLPALEVQVLYRLATCLLFPSRFEGWGLPVSEAFFSGLPVASSNASCLPETCSGAALLFDPDDVEAIADALTRLMTDEQLRADLRRRGREVAARLSWVSTAAGFRELYLRVAGRA
jgi:glycosyltransferase involved in cell wall biosynthesis